MIKTLMAAVAATGLSAGAAFAAGGEVHILDNEWSFEGPMGSFDRAELQRGWQVYSEVCSSCHSLQYVSFRNLGDPGGPEFPPEQVKAIAAAFPNKIIKIDDAGDEFEADPTPSDPILGPYANDKAAMASNGGALPPDLSLITKARTGYHGIVTQILEGSGGPEYVYSLLLGYQDEPPKGFDPGSLSYNKYFPGHQIAMGQPLYEDSVEYQDGTKATLEQQSHDVVAFLTWAAEPKLEERKFSGVRNIAVLLFFGVLVWYSNKKLWKSVKYGDD